MTREHIISALKRNDKVGITGIIAVAMGADEEAVEALTGTTRATDKFYQSVFDLVSFEERTVDGLSMDEEVIIQEIVDKEKALTDVDKEMEETADNLEELFEAVTSAINKGKKKKAKKAFEALEASGMSGSEMKALKKQIKAL